MPRQDAVDKIVGPQVIGLIQQVDQYRLDRRMRIVVAQHLPQQPLSARLRQRIEVALAQPEQRRPLMFALLDKDQMGIQSGYRTHVSSTI